MSSTPYAGTSGWSGSDTSRERAQRDDSTGVTAYRHRRILRSLSRAREHGRTVAEIQTELGVGHGSASGALTVLHKGGHITRVKERRNRQEVYVLPEHVDAREESPYRPNPARARLAQAEATLDRVREVRAALHTAAQATATPAEAVALADAVEMIDGALNGETS